MQARKFYVYFVQAGSGPIKIRFSCSVENRIYTLQQSHYEHLTILGYIEGTQELERSLHARVKNSCIRGEWFNCTAEVIELIRATLKHDVVVTHPGRIVVSEPPPAPVKSPTPPEHQTRAGHHHRLVFSNSPPADMNTIPIFTVKRSGKITLAVWSVDTITTFHDRIRQRLISKYHRRIKLSAAERFVARKQRTR